MKYSQINQTKIRGSLNELPKGTRLLFIKLRYYKNKLWWGRGWAKLVLEGDILLNQIRLLKNYAKEVS